MKRTCNNCKAFTDGGRPYDGCCKCNLGYPITHIIHKDGAIKQVPFSDEYKPDNVECPKPMTYLAYSEEFAYQQRVKHYSEMAEPIWKGEKL